ncbi:hypothetical protein JMJ77_0012263 [Colletotrichum scovillei]|uniref:Uncharacterized protein n=1 Tax=Colletotrichum scovillei TaxID=1209932 RepID=A0A9P7QUF6_9PEZI|nr:hypothetical protein JMJ78_0001315 [Colletotrichum scovillei]KAG7041745.1 hypothetical protein JMJ77_0012263 [Colletotrichum scovillei]KAG7061774.1 hypothetical protein JMJ76_0003731 [Colletotrichum scovillei]
MVYITSSEFQQSFHDPPTQGPSTAPNIRKKLQVALHPGLSSNPLTITKPMSRLCQSNTHGPWMEEEGRGGPLDRVPVTSLRPIILNLVHPAPPQTVSLSVQASDHRPSVAEPCTHGTTTDASWIDGYAVRTTEHTTISRLQNIH